MHEHTLKVWARCTMRHAFSVGPMINGLPDVPRWANFRARLQRGESSLARRPFRPTTRDPAFSWKMRPPRGPPADVASSGRARRRAGANRYCAGIAARLERHHPFGVYILLFMPTYHFDLAEVLPIAFERL